MSSTRYNFTETANYLNNEISLSELKEEVYTSALSLAHVDDPDRRGNIVAEVQAVAILILDLLSTIKPQ